MLLLVASLSSPAGAASDRLKLSARSTLTLINANEYVTGICGTITAEKLALEFAGDVTLTSPTGEILTGDAMVPSDTVVSNGTDSKKILIYGDVDRDARLGIGDVIAILKYVAGWDVDICEKAIDLNWDKKCDISDAMLLIRRIAGQNVCIGIDITPNQITLSYYDSDCTKLGVLWHSPKKTHNPAVQVVKGDTDDFSEARTILGYTSGGASGYSSRAVIDGLELGQTYSSASEMPPASGAVPQALPHETRTRMNLPLYASPTVSQRTAIPAKAFAPLGKTCWNYSPRPSSRFTAVT